MDKQNDLLISNLQERKQFNEKTRTLTNENQYEDTQINVNLQLKEEEQIRIY
jgi:hypothetical protein